ncbi:hypothetical protein PO909_031432 [Leuciscus waleckii]
MITKYPHHGPRPARSRRGVTKLSGVPLYGPAEKWLTCARWGLREHAGSERMNGNELSLILSLFAWSVDTLWSLVCVWQRISVDAVTVPAEV